MFTGIITAVGRITTASPFGDGMRLTIETPVGYLDDVAIGDSIAIQGACMTATQIEGNQFTLDISRESLNKTIGLDLQAPVNLEKALRLSDRLGGHLVSGHVDGVGQVERFAAVDQSPDGSWHLVIQAPAEIAPFLAYKGSIVVNGVSLTVNVANKSNAGGCTIEINIIPHTMQYTTLGQLKAGDAVNLEVDLIARYVARLMDFQAR
jgi:riboflavin synthase